MLTILLNHHRYTSAQLFLSKPWVERRRSAWLEFFNTEADLVTFIFLFFKKSMELCKHSAGGMSFKITGLSLHKHQLPINPLEI